jgi:hypothetical protein
MQLKAVKINVDIARNLWGDLSPIAVRCLEDLSRRYQLSVTSGDILYLEGKWYVTQSGLLGIARRKRFPRRGRCRCHRPCAGPG